MCFIHVTVKNSLGFTIQDCNRVMEHTHFLLLTRSTSVKGCCSRIEREARKIADVPLTLPASYFLFLRRIGSMDWTKLGRQRYRQGSTAPAPAPTSAHSRQQITNVEAISGRTAVLPLTWAPTSLEQLASRFIVPPPAPQHNPSASAGSYSSAIFYIIETIFCKKDI